MNYERVGDVLNFIREFHKRAERLFEAASEQAAQGRLRMLLEWLAEREARFAEAIETFEKAPENSVLIQEWLQYLPELDALELDLPKIGAEMSVDDAMALAIAFDNYLVRLLDAVTATCHGREVCELFEQMLEQERGEGRALARNLAEFQDI